MPNRPAARLRWTALAAALILTMACATPATSPAPPAPLPTVAPDPTGVPTSNYLSAQDMADIQQYFREYLEEPVTLWLFTVAPEGGALMVFRVICQDLTKLDPRFHFEDRDYQKDTELVASFGLDKGPAVVVTNGASQVPAAGDKSVRIVRFYGIPEGLQFGVMVQDAVDLSREATELAQDTVVALSKISSPVSLEVFFNPT